MRTKIKIRRKKYNLIQLENDIRQAYASYLENPDDNNGLNLFYGIQKLAFAILNIKYNANNFNRDIIAYEYALYLFQRIISKEFLPKPKSGGLFPWQRYIDYNIKYILFSKISEASNKGKEVYKDDQSYVDIDSFLNIENKNIRRLFEELLFDQLRNFYTENEITRLYPLAIKEMPSEKNFGKVISSNLPKDLEAFTITTIALSKRIVKELNIKRSHISTIQKPIHNAIQRSIKSTLFLSTLANEKKFPKGLFMSLDMDNLYRLIATMGGKTIRVPTEREMDTLIAGIVMISEMIENNSSFSEAVKKAKEEYQCVLSKQINLRVFIKGLCNDFFMESSDSTPLIQTLKTTSDFLDDLFPKLLERIKEEPTQYGIDLYIETSKLLSKTTENLIELSEKINNI